MCLLHRHKQDCKLETTATNLAKDALEIAACQCFAYQAAVFADNYLGKAGTNKNLWDLVVGAPLSVGKAALSVALGDTEASEMGPVGCSVSEKTLARGVELITGDTCGTGSPTLVDLSAHVHACHPSEAA